MSEQEIVDTLPEAEPAPCLPRWPLAARLARHWPDGTTLVTLASVIAFAIISTG